jgi:hypothetical protein
MTLVPIMRRAILRKIRMFLGAIGLALASLPVAAVPAGAVVCHDRPGMCCEDPVILGKTIDIPIDCNN